MDHDSREMKMIKYYFAYRILNNSEVPSGPSVSNLSPNLPKINGNSRRFPAIKSPFSAKVTTDN